MRERLFVVLLAACSGGGHSVDGPPHVLPDGPCGVDGITGSVPGVTLAIHGDSCVFRRGTGGTFTYAVTTSGTTPAIAVPGSGGGCGPCNAYSTDPVSFLFARIGGTSPQGVQQQYCVCDVGCCPPTQDRTIQVTATTSSASYAWSGRTWSGPSDTGNQEGDFFLQGVYNVSVTFNGFDAGSVVAELPIEVTDP